MNSEKHSPVLLVHGGAWAIPASDKPAHERGVRRALAAGWDILERGGPALDAVAAAVKVLEDDETFDAGRGSFLTSDGRVQLDALLMDGGRMKAGGVACVERIRNPIEAARLVLEKSPHVYFVGPGAEDFAAAHGMPLIDNSELVLDRERNRLRAAQQRAASGLADETFSGQASSGHASSGQASATNRKQRENSPTGETPTSASGPSASGPSASGPSASGPSASGPSASSPDPSGPGSPAPEGHDTVGAVALDALGNLAAGTSTGGTLNKAPGRVGDSSLIGCGCYADNLSAAVSLTGWGEPIMKLVLGKWATDRVAAGSPPELAARDAISYLHSRLGGHGGIILLGPDGRFGFAHNTPAMAWGLATTAAGFETGLEYHA